jgi:hypothetical protein
MRKQRKRIFKRQFQDYSYEVIWNNCFDKVMSGSNKKCVFGTFASYTDTTDKTKLLPMDGVEIYESWSDMTK